MRIVRYFIEDRETVTQTNNILPFVSRVLYEVIKWYIQVSE